jgi:acyl-CoA reductase-like NAD-dependent aldehyde dehydrogenase
VQGCFRNTGRSRTAPTRMLVPRSNTDEAAAVAEKVAEAVNVNDRPRKALLWDLSGARHSLKKFNV